MSAFRIVGNPYLKYKLHRCNFHEKEDAMAAKKLPSGSWRAKVYDYTDSKGKEHYKSFTASTKSEAERMAAQYRTQKERYQNDDLTVAEAIDGFIKAYLMEFSSEETD